MTETNKDEKYSARFIPLVSRIQVHLLLNFHHKSNYSSVSFNTFTSITLKNEAVTNEE
tara:strand:- start:241 stop:414 length:174 start_codon:yes stop_codon:yes gene_type:complete